MDFEDTQGVPKSIFASCVFLPNPSKKGERGWEGILQSRLSNTKKYKKRFAGKSRLLESGFIGTFQTNTLPARKKPLPFFVSDLIKSSSYNGRFWLIFGNPAVFCQWGI